MRNALFTVATIAVLSVLLVPTQARAQTTVSGPLSRRSDMDAGWKSLLLTGDVTIASGVALTIEAGVNVVVADSDDQALENEIEARVELIVIGGLHVNGSLLNRVTFSPQHSSSPHGSWRGIRVLPGTGRR